LRVWLQSLKKYYYDLKKNFVEKIKKGIKNAEYRANFKSIGKVLKNAHKKVLRKTSLTKVEKVHNSVTFLLITFFG
jgi:hypothetical protein